MMMRLKLLWKTREASLAPNGGVSPYKGEDDGYEAR